MHNMQNTEKNMERNMHKICKIKCKISNIKHDTQEQMVSATHTEGAGNKFLFDLTQPY